MEMLHPLHQVIGVQMDRYFKNDNDELYSYCTLHQTNDVEVLTVHKT